MPTLNQNLTALVDFLANVSKDELGPSGTPSGPKYLQPQSQDAKNHSRALLLFTDLCVKQTNGKFALNENIDEAFSEMAATPAGKKKLQDALSKMEMVFKNYNGVLYQAFGLDRKEIATQFQEKAGEYIAEYKKEKINLQENIASESLSRIKTVTEDQLKYLQADLLDLKKGYDQVVEKRSSGFTGKARLATGHFFKSANPDRHGQDIDRLINLVNAVISDGKELEQRRTANVERENQLARNEHQSLPQQTISLRVEPEVSSHTKKIGQEIRTATGQQADVLKKEVQANKRMGASIKEKASKFLDASAKDREVKTQQPSPKEKEYQQNLNKTFYITISKIEEAFLKALKVPPDSDSTTINKRLRELQKDKKEHMFLKLTAQTLNGIYKKYNLLLTQTPERKVIQDAALQVADAQKALAFKT